MDKYKDTLCSEYECFKSGMVAHTSHLSTPRKTRQEGLEFEASLCVHDSNLKTKLKKGKT